MTVVSTIACDTYYVDDVRRSVAALLAPWGGIGAFVQPGMRVLLKPNLLSASALERAVTTHPAIVEAVTELVRDAGGTVLIGDSPAGPVENHAKVYRSSGMVEVAARTGATLVPFHEVSWRRLNGHDYFITRPVLEADVLINLPKLKTHAFARYTGAVKNLFGTIPGGRKHEVHLRAPGISDFSRALVDVLELVRPALSIMDGVLGQEGEGPGARGTPRPYGCLAASRDSVALDAVMAQAMGYRSGQVLYLAEAGERNLGTADAGRIRIIGDRQALDFGRVRLPATHWYFRAPSWISAPIHRSAGLRPRIRDSQCVGCGQCATVCPREVIEPGRPPRFDLDHCVGCMCCAEICPEGAIEARESIMARLTGAGI